MTKRRHTDSFNLLCGEKIGSGIHRNVFECRIRPDLVVKVEHDDRIWREFANVREMKFWCDNQHYDKVAQWLAPCEFMSPDGWIMLQKKARPINDEDVLPVELPGFLGDIKRDNFGYINNKLVCIDYAIVIDRPNVKPRKVEW